MRSITVEIYYPGAVISVNHYKYRGRYTRSEAKAWMDALGWQIKQAHIEDWKLPLEVTCSGQFRDARSAPDLSNLAKVALDAIEEVSGVNDRDMRWHDGDRVIKNDEEPKLIITISEAI